MVVFGFGVGAYVIFLLSFLYAIGFVENWIVARTIDGVSGTGAGDLAAWLGNAVLLGLFALQHSIMARPAFKRAWTKIVPAAMERSVFVLCASLLLFLLFLRWTPIPREVWNFGVNPVSFVIEMLSYVGWTIVLAATFQIDHFELFGLKQVWFHARGEPLPVASFQVPFFYRWVRHPIYLGFVLAFWCTPRMTLGHLLFAVLTTGYMLFALRLEERDLVHMHPEYRAYRERVPMIFPLKAPLPPEPE
jgi:protein-S-isoprenylcysteine O-methyltransferase Ste14